MTTPCGIQRIVAGLAMVLTSLGAGAQSAARKAPPSKDSVVVPASDRYGAGAFHRYWLGDNWRDVWAAPISVPVLNLHTFAGGLEATETGGTKQTKTLHLTGRDGVAYVFRPVYKERLEQLEPYKNTIIEDIFRDGLSALHPTGPLAVPPFLRAAGVLHVAPTLYVMPDDPALGKFREEFAGKLGAIEDRAKMPERGPGVGGATEIIDSEDLLKLINRDAREHVDARGFLTARLIDILLNDNDRHLNQWRWARLQPRLAGSTPDDVIPWVPIPRDRDAVFVNHEGVLMRFARIVKPNLVAFTANYPSMRAFAGAVIDLDQRLLVGLDKTVWDSVVFSLKTRITDAVIDSAVRNMPREYWPLSASVVTRLRSRRDKLHVAADDYYRVLAEMPEIHATDADDRATVVRDGRDVVVRIQSGGSAPWFERRFKREETREIRLYLHGGNDHTLATGNGNAGIWIRIVGGNGSNMLNDSSTVAGRHRLTRLYDRGTIDDVKYGRDTVFNRRPWVQAYGKDVPPLKDRGSKARPTFSFGSGSGLGLVSKIGYDRFTYGFRYMPYKEKVGVELEYASFKNRVRLGFGADRRVENSQWHYLVDAELSQLEMVETRGFGNTVEDDTDDPFFDVNQTQWIVRPAVGLALGPKGDLSLGPIVKYVTTDSLRNNFISRERPLGFPHFGQAGVQLVLDHDTRDTLSTRGFVVRASSSYYPQVWDAEEAFGEVSAVVSTYLTAPVWTRPTLALRGGGKRVFGEAPYYEAAFIGGRRSLRTVKRQRFAGDASLHGTAELRVPVLRFNYLLPWSIGAIGFMEAGRVYNDGDSPGTWHSARGVGGWIGLLSPKYAIHLLHTNRPERRLIIGTGFAF